MVLLLKKGKGSLWFLLLERLPIRVITSLINSSNGAHSTLSLSIMRYYNLYHVYWINVLMAINKQCILAIHAIVK